MRAAKMVATLGSGLVMALAACGANSSSEPAGGSADGSEVSGGGVKVGVILPEVDGSCQWECIHKPLLHKALRAQGLDPDIQNAAGDEQKYSILADGMISSGVKVLIIASISTEGGNAVAAKAQAQGIPVIDYDRLNLGGSSDYYVSFDGNRVGALQGQALSTALQGKQGAQVIEIEGSPTDNNAKLFYDGQQSVVKPLYDSGQLKLVGSQFIDKWDDQLASTTFEQLLSGNGGKVDGVLSANDGFANAVITVLSKYGLNGKVPVTGQDATAVGLQNILRGDQYMTVWKDIRKEADAAAKIAGALANGDTAAADKVATQKANDPKGNRTVKAVLIDPQTITKDGIKTVVDAGFIKASQICTSQTQAACDAAGIK